MEWIHYSSQQFKLTRNDWPSYCQPVHLHSHLHRKPSGLWLSEESTSHSWLNYCKQHEMFYDLKFRYKVKLNNDKLLQIRTKDELREFSSRFGIRDNHFDLVDGIDWFSIENFHDYGGIIICPYQPECRYSLETSWYYTWDVSSACIWSFDCIESFVEDDMWECTEFYMHTRR